MAATAPPQKVPSTPHNQKRPPGPLPSLISTLREDNHEQLVQLLTLDPISNVPLQLQHHHHPDVNAARSTQPKVMPMPHKQRLVFCSESIRKLFLYHVLPDPQTRGSSSKKRKVKGSLLTPEEEALGLTSDNLFGIVGTRVLFPGSGSSSSDGSHISASGDTNSPSRKRGEAHIQNHATGSETIYNPQNNGSNQDFTSFKNAEDQERDARDNASVIIYFIHPTPMHVRAVCQRIKQHHSKASSSALSSSHNAFESVYASSSDNMSANNTKIVKHRIVFLPHCNALSRRVLDDENILSSSSSISSSNMRDVSIHTLEIDLIPLEDDVLTCLELSSFLKDCDVDGIPSDPVTTVARSLIKIQDVVGVVERVQSYGTLGEMVLQRMMSLRMEDYDPYKEEEEENHPENGASLGSSEIAAMMVIDRKVDMVTPMLTPLTYEGLLDDVLKIDSGFIKVHTDIIDPPEESSAAASNMGGSNTSKDINRPSHMTLPLNDMDTLYGEVRDQHVEKFGTFLQGQAKALKESHANFSDKNKDLTELHKFVKQIPIFTQSLKSLTNHIHLAELVKQTTEQSEFRQRWQTERSMVESENCYEILEDLIACQHPPFRLLRLLCLQSLTSGGLKAAKFDSLRREVVQTYGYEYLFVLQNLEKLGLLKKSESTWMDTASPFTTIRKQLGLINADVDPIDPNDVSFVSSGYAPISARIIQTAMKGWTGKEDTLRELSGRGVDIVQRHPPEDFVSAVKRDAGPPLGVLGDQLTGRHFDDNNKPVLLVYFVGGVTYMEIAAMRFLSKRENFPFNIICCTTKIINGNTFLSSLC